MKITFTRLAMVSIKSQMSYKTEKSSLKAATQWRKGIFDTVEYLKSQPQLGKEDKRFVNYKYEVRYLIKEDFRIYYEFTGEVIFILNIVHRNQIHGDFRLF